MGALGDPYVTVGELREYTRIGDMDDDLTIQRVVGAASRSVEAFTGRQFNKTTSASARFFRPVDWRRVVTDDFHTVTGLAVSVNGTAWDVADIEVRPLNGVVEGQSGWPFHMLYASTGTWPYFESGAVSVTAQWGWLTVPDAVEQATLIQAARILGRRNSPHGLQSIGSGDFVFRVSTITDPDVQQLLEPYRLRRLVVA